MPWANHSANFEGIQVERVDSISRPSARLRYVNCGKLPGPDPAKNSLTADTPNFGDLRRREKLAWYSIDHKIVPTKEKTERIDVQHSPW